MRGAPGPRLGEYVETGSSLHRVPAMIKIVAAAALLLAAGWGDSRTLAVLLAGAALTAWSAGMPFRLALSLVKVLFWFACFSLLTHLLLGGGRGPGIPSSWIELGARGKGAGVACLRASLALTVLNTFMMTTPPLDAAEAVVASRVRRRPRRGLGGLGLAVVIALRFWPLLAEELTRLRRAREARGAEFAGAGRRRALKDWAELFPAFLLTALRRAEEVALALEARGLAR